VPPERSDPGPQTDPAAIEAIAVLALRLARVMRPAYITTWLDTTGIEALGGEAPIDLIARGEIGKVAELVSGLEDPGAT
jgi:hypothetical protein